MTRDDIIRLAREADFAEGLSDNLTGEVLVWDAETKHLERFAALVAAHVLVEPCCQQFDKCQKVCMPRAAAAEREACAKVCDAHVGIWIIPAGPKECAAAIRARGTKE
jgi:predicted kinase